MTEPAAEPGFFLAPQGDDMIRAWIVIVPETWLYGPRDMPLDEDGL